MGHGPWEGGIRPDEVPEGGQNRGESKLCRFWAWNVKGALAAPGAYALQADRVEALCDALLADRVAIAAIGEPRVGEGIEWDGETLLYDYHGVRSGSLDTVALLVRRDVAKLHQAHGPGEALVFRGTAA